MKESNHKLKRSLLLIQRAYYSLLKEGPNAFVKRIKTYFLSKKIRNLVLGKFYYDELCHKWIETKEKEYFTATDFEKEISRFKFAPTISIIMPVYNVDIKWLRKCIESVKNQSYQKWELCAVDDCSNDENIKALLEAYSIEDSRIKCEFLTENIGIAGASNRSAEMSSGEYLALLDNDDELAPNALFEVVKLLNEKRSAKFIYSDEDKIDAFGARSEPYFKPDFSPDLLLSSMYTSHLSVYERNTFFSCGGFKNNSDGSQDYDLALRASEIAGNEICHISKILYHWRKVKGSTADNHLAKHYTKTASLQALKSACERRGIKGEVVAGEAFGTFIVKRKLLDNERVSVIIPFKDKAPLLKQCIKSVSDKGGYENIEYILINNASKDKETLDYIKELKKNKDVTLLDYNDGFNYSAMNNRAAKAASGKFLLLLNNDIKAISDDFIVALKEHAQRDEVGAVGAKLLCHNMTVQHAGVILGVNGVADHAFKRLHHCDNGYFFQANVTRNVSAVTAACMMIRKEVFMKVGGFDEANLAVELSDVDLCLRLLKVGYVNVYTPHALLYHYESASRGGAYNEKEVEFMKKRYGDFLFHDPYYNINLSLKNPYFLPDVI